MIKSIRFTLASLLFASFAFVSSAQAGTYHKFTVTVNYSGVATNNVPVLLRLAERDDTAGSGISSFSYSHFKDQVSGTDLEIADGDGNPLPYEIETWDTSGESLVWVKMPVFENGKTLTVSYGKSNMDGTLNAKSVWSSYVGVWHLDNTNSFDEANGNYGTYPNSTAAVGIDAEKAKRSIADEEGKIGKGVLIAENTQTYRKKIGSKDRVRYGGVFVADNSDDGPLDVGSTFTISGWFKLKSAFVNNQHQYDCYFTKRAQIEDATGGFWCDVHGLKGDKMRFNGAATSTTERDISPCDVSSLEWVHLVFVFNGTKCTVYYNGQPTASVNKDITAATNNNLPLCFGSNVGAVGDGDGNCTWGGWMDEVRFSGSVAGAEYIAAEYAAMADSSVLEYSAATPEEYDSNLPAISAAPSFEWSYSENAFVFSVPVDSGAGKIKAEFTDLADISVKKTVLIATLDGSETASSSYTASKTVTTADGLEANHMYSFSAIACNSAESESTKTDGSGNVYFGALTATKDRDADESKIGQSSATGQFTVSLAAQGVSTAADLTLALAYSGAAATDGAATGPASVVIPAGQSSVTVEITPVYNASVTEDETLTLSIAGLNVENGAVVSASLTVVNSPYDIYTRYVATTGDDSSLGFTAETPVKTIGKAISLLSAASATVPSVAKVAPGTYEISSGLSIAAPVSVVGCGDGPGDVIVKQTAKGGNNRVFYLDNESAVVSNLTMTGGTTASNAGAGFYIGLGGGLVTHCIVEDCKVQANDANGFPAGACLLNGRVSHTIFRNLKAPGNPSDSNAAFVLKLHGQASFSSAIPTLGGSADNCLIVDCNTTGSVHLVTLQETDVGSLRNVTIACCSVTGDGVNTRKKDGTPDKTTTISSIYAATAKEVKNVVIAGVTGVGGVPLPITPKDNGSHCANCAVDYATAEDHPTWMNGKNFVFGTTDSFFKNYASGVFIPRSNGGLVDAGASYSGMSATDLLGNSRVIGEAVDIGAFEGLNMSGVMFLVY